MVPHGEDVEVRRCHCALHFGVFDVSELSNSIDRPILPLINSLSIGLFRGANLAAENRLRVVFVWWR